MVQTSCFRLKQRLPNLLTFSRIIVIPLLVAAFYLPAPACYWVTCALFVYASLTDFLDGYLARRWQVESALGRFLDPIADKLLVTAALVCLASDARAHEIAVAVILMREMLVAGLREHLMEKQIPLPVSTLAKYKTAVQMVAVLLLLIGPAFPLLLEVGRWMLWLAATLTVITGWDYLRSGLKHLRD